MWSYTENHYAPPPPYVAADPFVPFALAAVELEAEGIVVLGQVKKGVTAADLEIGMEMELDLDTLYADTEHEYLVYVWESVDLGARPAHRERGVRMSDDRDLAILGVGMHPWGKWGNNFIEYGLVAARAALDDAGRCLAARSSTSPAPTQSATATPGSSPAPRSRRSSGLDRCPRCRRPTRRARRAPQAMQTARAQLLAGFCDVALVIGADTTPKGFFAPVGGERKSDPDWLRFHLLGATNPTYFALNARRRIDVFGATHRGLRHREGEELQGHGLENPNARFRKESTVEDVLARPMVADPSASSTSAPRPTAPPP